MFTVLRQTEERAETERPHRFFALFKKISQKKRKTCTHLSKTVDGTFKKGFTLAFVLLHKLTPAPKLYFGLKQSFFCVLTDVFLLFFSMSTPSPYSVTFQQNNGLRSSSQSLECKSFFKRLFQSPSDRHVYGLKFYATPIR
jgi:hypothetical protein